MGMSSSSSVQRLERQSCTQGSQARNWVLLFSRQCMPAQAPVLHQVCMLPIDICSHTHSSVLALYLLGHSAGTALAAACFTPIQLCSTACFRALLSVAHAQLWGQCAASAVLLLTFVWRLQLLLAPGH